MVCRGLSGRLNSSSFPQASYDVRLKRFEILTSCTVRLGNWRLDSRCSSSRSSCVLNPFRSMVNSLRRTVLTARNHSSLICWRRRIILGNKAARASVANCDRTIYLLHRYATHHSCSLCFRVPPTAVLHRSITMRDVPSSTVAPVKAMARSGPTSILICVTIERVLC